MKKKLSFYDLKEKKVFETTNYKVVNKDVKGINKKFAVAINPKSKNECWRVISNK